MAGAGSLALCSERAHGEDVERSSANTAPSVRRPRVCRRRGPVAERARDTLATMRIASTSKCGSDRQ